MWTKLKAKYASMRPEQQQKATIAMIVGGIGFFAGLAFLIAPLSSKTPPPVSVSVGVPAGKSVLSVDDKLLEKTVMMQNDQKNKEVEDLKKLVESMKNGGAPGLPQNGGLVGQQNPFATAPGAQGKPAVAQLDQIINQKNAQAPVAFGQGPAPTVANRRQRSLPPVPPSADHNGGTKMSFSPPPPPGGGSSAPYYQQAPADKRNPRAGGIGVHVNEIKEVAKTAGDGSGKKKDSKRAVYLPPSFMEAVTLSGLNAPTSDAGRGNPVPLIIRIAAPAVLPNSVRANLKGCFVIAEAVGSLSDERAHCRLVSISCLSKKGMAVIDQEINGFVQDSDGGIGLTGRVVSKMGAAVARLAAIGLLKGVGDAMALSSTSTATSPLGQVSSLGTSAKDMGMNIAGSAISSSAKGLAKIFEDLTLGSLPVIEVGNGKKITLVVTKGVSLEIKNYKTVPWY